MDPIAPLRNEPKDVGDGQADPALGSFFPEKRPDARVSLPAIARGAPLRNEPKDAQPGEDGRALGSFFLE
jgi:hypothetical protein